MFNEQAPRKRHKPYHAAHFLDIEAEASAGEEEEEEDKEDGSFIDMNEDADSGSRDHPRWDTHRHTEQEEKSPEQIVRELSYRHRRAPVRYTGDMNEVPQRLLMPSVHDANLWQVRVKPGLECEIVFGLMRKSIAMEHTLQIISAFQRDSLPGIIYVEARSPEQVTLACNGIAGVHLSRGIQLVPIAEMSSLLTMGKQERTVNPGDWVRINRHGKYQGDLAQVVGISDECDKLYVRHVPRIELTAGAKRKRDNDRPPPKLFNVEKVVKKYGRGAVSTNDEGHVFEEETYRDGFLVKDYRLDQLVSEEVNPTLDEITQFSSRDGASMLDLSSVAEASSKAAVSALQPGDHVEVSQGEQRGVHGVVENVDKGLVTIRGTDGGPTIDISAKSVQRRFKPGDHVRVITGEHANKTGLVLSEVDHVVMFLCDMSMQQVSVLSRDLGQATEVVPGTKIDEYELHDLVQLDPQTVGVILATNRDSLRVLDQHGRVRLVQSQQISMHRNSKRAVAIDSQGHELSLHDEMREIEGEGRSGRVLHIHQSFYAFLHNRDLKENDGVFVTRARNLKAMAVRTDLNKMNPAFTRRVPSMVKPFIAPPPPTRLDGVHVVVNQGQHQGESGIIQDTNDKIARVIMNATNKVVSIEKVQLYRRLPNGDCEPLECKPCSPAGVPSFFRGYRTPNPYHRNPAPTFSTQTTHHHSRGQTAAKNPSSRGPNPSSRTPNPYAATPAWDPHSRTPNPYAGGQTPAWNAASRTPNPYIKDGAGRD